MAPSIAPKDVAARRVANPHRPRIFIYIIDSLRYETAVNGAVMPHLQAFAAEGARAKVLSGFNSLTSTALRNAFTGHENTTVMAVVTNFLKTDAGVESIFHQMALQGITTAAYSHGFFRQFGAGVAFEAEVPGRSSFDTEEKNVFAGVEALRRGDYDVVVGHIAYTDYTAHIYGIGRKEYREVFARADGLIPRIRERLPAGATMVVMGDHGHDSTGKHIYGMDVPTFLAYAGPPFRRGVDLGTVSLTSHRYLLSEAAGVPLKTEGYAGEILPAALNRDDNHLPTLLSELLGARSGITWSGSIWIYISALSALWLNLVFSGYSPLNFTGGRAAVLWLGMAPLLATGTTQWIAEALAIGLIFLVGARGTTWRQIALWVALPTLVILLFHGWGRVLVALRPWAQELSYTTLAAAWAVVAVVGALLATRARRAWVMSVVLAVPGLLFHPTNYPYGFSGTVTPLVFCWFLFFAVSAIRDGALRQTNGAINWASVQRLGFAGMVVFLLLQPFAATEARAGYFVRWRALLPDSWSANNFLALVWLAFLAKAVIFFPRWPGIARVCFGGVLILLLVATEGQLWPMTNSRWMFMLGALAAAWWFDKPGRPMLGTAFLFALYYYCIWLTPRNYLEIGCMIAALVMCARLATWFPQPELVRFDCVVLGLLGLLVSGWAFARWTVSEVEWHLVYQWFDAQIVEKKVALFLPFIALKFLAPWFVIVNVLRAEFANRIDFAANGILLFFSLKMISLLAINNGLGGADTFNRSYLEGACVSGLMAVLFLGVILLPRSWPRPLDSTPGG